MLCSYYMNHNFFLKHILSEKVLPIFPYSVFIFYFFIKLENIQNKINSKIKVIFT